MIKPLTKIAILSLLLLQSIGCTKEDMTDCGRLGLHFSYTSNNLSKDLLATSVKDIRVYLFDEAQTLAGVLKIDAGKLKDGYTDASIKPGVYSAVAWGSSGAELTNGGFQIMDMANPSGFIPVEIGRTKRDDFAIILACNPLSPQTLGQVTPMADAFDDLYHALVENITIVGDQNQSQTINFSLIKNTNTLNVTVTGLEHLSQDPLRRSTFGVKAAMPLDVFALAHNDIYKVTNAIGINSRLVRYRPNPKHLDATTMKVDFRLTRLDIVYHIEKPVYLHIQNPATQTDMITPLNVMEAILKVKDAQGKAIYNTQQDIDRNDTYPIEVSIASDLRVTISINGFVIEDIDAEINRP